ncbi:AGE family epimerase/isomerase [Maritalea sp.]|uniref:AGE family epimerase/isomerase n=1 Tax=Maritalea sp. TaxID=2003361 RepID=UPI003EF82AE3
MESPLIESQARGESLLSSSKHRSFLLADAQKQLAFFDQSRRPDGGFYVLERDGTPAQTTIQELHNTTRMIHSFSLGKIAGIANCENVIDQGLNYLTSHHLDPEFGGYFWALDGKKVHDERKLAYGHVFVLLAAASAHAADHPAALPLLDKVDEVLEKRFWEKEHQLFSDEWNRDWTPFSTYRGMNANMHGVEALLSAYEATGRRNFLEKAGSILDFFVFKRAASQSWRVPEHYTDQWAIDHDYSENPMFRPAGTTPGHSFELARLLLQYWDLMGRPEGDYQNTARRLAYRAVEDAWDDEKGGFYYTLDFDGNPAITDRYWWPVTEAIGVMAAFIKLGGTAEDERWYNRLWQFAQANLIDQEYGGWFPELDENNQSTDCQFVGKPDIYHSLQAALLPLCPNISQSYEGLAELAGK